AVKEGGELLQQGFAAYRHDRFAEAEQALGKAMRSLEQGAALLDNPVSLIQAHQLMGQLQLKQGKTREAISWFRRAITLAPASPLDPSVFPGETIEVYERTRQEATAESSRLEVSSAPRGAAVLLDGRFVGVTPVELKLDTAGRHLLQLNADGFLPEGTAIDLQPGKTAKLQRSLKPVRHADSFLEVLERAMDGLGEEELTSDSGIHELGELLEVEELVLVRMSATRDKQAVVEGFHYDFLDGQLINVGDRLFSPGGKSLEQDAAQFVDDLLSARLDLSLAGSLPLAQLPPGANYTGGPAKAREEAGAAASEAPGSGRRSRWASPWLWVGVGGAAVAAAGATAILLAGTEEEEEPTRPENGRLLFGFE
ncbi:MAG: PEGA domain-containing protein, partial [Deltaproteobacteria bacterium]|nr:PEGA domain-containing protein [Deltaproteobacteria bacterium]